MPVTVCSKEGRERLSVRIRSIRGQRWIIFREAGLDGQVLTLYVWLAASRYDEYRTNTACSAESLSETYLIAPPEFALFRQAQPIPFGRLRTVADWVF
jgi:hypothetical protein